ncbi:sensor histidine kinase [Edaphobacter flagellatus]|jgi:signal transduction histidine kinase|uniref:sensor histidine kinase n=1 Tax=Edaphobacter flagellatus TaxID=1933044 RepID=UPI0021B4AACC|nr:HAMP domain-containing sensor histidine kinase [Edaphobacter flagellatus]HZY71976.1 HAMP domain-containing sensor histidine kinase [Edaphobacter sp.]
MPYRASLANTIIVNRSIIGSVYLAVLLIFFGAQMLFTTFLTLPPRPVFFLVSFAVGLRLIEIVSAKQLLAKHVLSSRWFAAASISWTLALALLLAVLTRQPDTHYFGMLILPILEAAIYFSLMTTLLVAMAASSLSLFWVAYVAHFRSPFPAGEILEASTLVLVYFIIGCLVWLLVHMLRDREEQLQQQLDDLNATRGKLIEEEKLAAIGRLASAVAHEIRNPVAIISSALETSASTSLASIEREEMARIAGLEAKRLEKLTTDFLSYAKPGSAPFERLDAATLVGYIVSIMQPQALQKGLRIEVETNDPGSIYGDEGQLQQMLLNIMRNAIEASPRNGCVLLTVVREPNENHQIRIENAGPAIPPHVVHHIFEPFFTAKQGGTGLGLAIARSIVDRHYGELHLERNETDHVVFAITLPSNRQVVGVGAAHPGTGS